MRKFSSRILVNRSILFAQFLALIMTPFSLSAQSSEWFENGTSWSYNFQVNGQLSTETRIATFQITEQTTFADRDCAKMELMDANWAPFSTWNPCIPAEAPYYFYESNDSVFYASEIDSTFHLAYYFGAEADDNWLFVVPAQSDWAGAGFSGVDTFLVTVLSVAQISLDGQELKVMELAYENISSIIQTAIEPFTVTVTEKIGSSQYFFIPIFDIGGEIWVCEGAWDIELQCYNSASLNYVNPDFGSCTLTAGHIEPEHAMSIYPNPSGGTFQVSLPDANERIERVEMYDLQGRTVAHTSYLEESQARIEIHNLAAGIYLVKAGSVKGAYTQKLVVE
jgi:hypothetical protein